MRTGYYLLLSLPWEKQPQLVWLVGEDWAGGRASGAVGLVAAGLTAECPSAVVGAGQSLEAAVMVALVALVVSAAEMGAAAADGVCGEASVVFLVSRDPGFGGRYLPKRPRGRPVQTAPTTSCTWVWKSIPVFRICTNVLRDTSLLLL